MNHERKTAWAAGIALLVVCVLLLTWTYVAAHPEQLVYRVVDTTRDQFLGREPGALGSTSRLYFTAVTNRDDGEVQLLPLGIVGEWEILASPLLPNPIEGPTAVAYIETESPYRKRIYLIGGRDPTPPAHRLDTIYSSQVQPDGSLTAWVLQDARLPRGLASAASALSTENVYGDPITPTIYLIGGKYDGGESSAIYYTHIDPVTLDITGWQTATSGLPAARLGLTAVANDGYLYAIGGFASAGSVYSAAVWHFSIDETGAPIGRTTDTPFPGDPTANPNAAYHQTLLLAGLSPNYLTDTLYVIGGYNQDGSTSRVLRADINPRGSAEEGYLEPWTDVFSDDLPEPLSAFAIAVGNVQGAGRQAYIVGGAQGVDGNIPQDTIRSAAVNDETNTFHEWYGSSWLTSPALPDVRYRHACVQVGDYIYAIAGHGTNDPAVTYDNTLRGRITGTGARQHAPQGEFLSRVVDLDRKYRLMWLQWTSTITPTDPGVDMVLQFRAGNRPDLSDAVDAWSDFLPSTRGAQTTTLMLVPQLPNFSYNPPIARYVQYRAVLSTTTTYSNITPLLHDVGMLVEDTPDLVVSSIQHSCDDCYGFYAIISQTITVRVTVRNMGKSVPAGNNFSTTLFLTNTAGYDPQPPDQPAPPRFLAGSTSWSVSGADLPAGASKVLTTTMVFTEPQRVFLYAQADYRGTGEAPDYDVGETDFVNNLTVRPLVVITVRPPGWIYLPLIIRPAPIVPTVTPEPTVEPTPSPTTPPSTQLLISFVQPGYPCKADGSAEPVRVKAYVTDGNGVPVSDATVIVSIGDDSWPMGPTAGSPGYYGSLDGPGCWNSWAAEPPTSYNTPQIVTISTSKPDYTGSSASESTSSQPACSSCP